jgi:DNA repair protein SbcC/Rad50
MKNVKLQTLELENFKKIKSLKIDFKDETNIHGANGIGKTTLFDAYNWLLFNKNSKYQSAFEIKTLTDDGEPIHNLEHSVTGVFNIDGELLELKKSYKENWTKKRGSETSELTGHTTKYFVNEVPKTLAEYKSIVDDILSEESQKILSDPLYFNTVMSWNNRRVILSELAGEISTDEVVKTMDSQNAEIINEMLNSSKSLEDYKKEFTAKRKKVKEELETLPTRIDEAYKSMPESKDWKAIEVEIKNNQVLIESINKQLESKSKQLDEQHKAVTDAKSKKFEVEQKLEILKRLSIEKSKASLNDLRTELEKTESSYREKRKDVIESTNKLEDYKSEIESKEKTLSNLNSIREQLIKDFTDITNSKFEKLDESLISCPTCKRDFDIEKIEDVLVSATEKFEEVKADKLSKINKEGAELKADRMLLEQEISTLKIKINSEDENKIKLVKELSEIESKGKTLKSELQDKETNLVVDVSPEEIALQKEIESIVIPDINISDDNSELKISKAEILTSIIDKLKIELHDKVIIDKQKERIAELESKQQVLAQEIASFEHKEIAIENFNKAKVDLIDKKVNSRFKIVKFKMFENQLNGGVNEICECTVDGVKINDVNNAMKINAGIDVINVLKEFYGVNSPIFIDNRESVTDILKTESQIINLVVDKDCKELEVK